MNASARIAKIVPRLEAWAATLAEFDAQVDAFCALTTAQPDSPLLDAIHRLEDAYTRTVSEKIGDVDGVWLHWWRWECEMGRKPMQAAAAGKPLRTIRTLKQMAALIVADSDA